MVKLYFTDFLEVSEDDLRNYGAFNISLINDVPLFIDPFLLFTSQKDVYRDLHEEIIRYVRFLRDKSLSGLLHQGLIKRLFTFHEVRQNWLGFSTEGNYGSGLGNKFARTLDFHFRGIFSDFGEESPHATHIEQLCLVQNGVGRDNISDLTTNLIKGFLLGYTQAFTQQFIKPQHRAWFTVDKVRFNYDVEVWERGKFELPKCKGDFVLLTPKDILTMDDTWISQAELVRDLEEIASSLPNEELRAQLNNYLQKKLNELPRKPKEEEIKKAKLLTVEQFRL